MVCCCFSCSCSARKMEYFFLVTNLVDFILLIVSIFVINFKHAGKTSLYYYIIMLILTALLLLFSILLVIWRKSNAILTKTKGVGKTFAILGMIFCIILVICSALSETSSSNNFYNKDYPCAYYDYDEEGEEGGEFIGYFLNLRTLSQIQTGDVNTDNPELSQSEEENIETLCKNVKDRDYYSGVCSKGEYIMAYLCSTFIEFFSFMGIILWCNEHRRINNGVDVPVVPSAGIPFGNGMINPGVSPYGLDQMGVYGSQYDPYGNPMMMQQNMQLQPSMVYVQGSRVRNPQNVNMNMNFSNNSMGIGPEGGNNQINKPGESTQRVNLNPKKHKRRKNKHHKEEEKDPEGAAPPVENQNIPPNPDQPS